MKTIKGKIFTRFLAVITLFFIVIAAAATVLTVQLTHQFAVRDSKNSLKFLVNNIKSSYFSHLKDLDDLATNPGFQAGETADALATVEYFLEFNTVFSTIHFYRPNGDLVFAKRKDGMWPYKPESNFNYKSPKFVKLANEVIATGKSKATPTFYTKAKYLYQLYLVPVKDENGEVVGLLSGGVFPRFHNLNYLLDGLALAPHNFIYISDDHGSTLATSGTVPAHLPEVGMFEVAECTEPDQGDPEDVNALAAFLSGGTDGSPYIKLSKSIPDLKLKVTLGINEELIHAKVSSLLQHLFVAFVICFLAAMVFSIYMGNKLSKPLQGMLEATKEIDKGNLDVSVKPGTNSDEFGELSQYMDSIRRKIKKDRLLGDIWGEEFS